jgi:hypothetical protein
MTITENTFGRRRVLHSTRYDLDVYQPILRLSKKNCVSYNEMVNRILRSHPRLGLI